MTDMPSGVVWRQWHDGVDAAHLAAEQEQGVLRAGDVRHREVEAALAGLQAGGLAHDGRRGEARRGG